MFQFGSNFKDFFSNTKQISTYNGRIKISEKFENFEILISFHKLVDT